MNFKKLEVYGFKSFADKLVVEFAPGITAIVGPNGCGKSNVADAIRWALGEQSAKSLRGSQMLDVIFSGTETRKSMSYCEVALYFDNTSRIFKSEYDEIVISRKLYRNLESVYSINKQETRLRDITALLHDSGLGKDSYSIIGQGRIDEILSAKAEDRRAIFEDAAGISGYKQVKLENERRLVRIQEKLTRIVDITNEQEKQLKPLEQQAENAKKAFLIKDTLRTLEVNAFLYQHDTAAERKSVVQSRIDAYNDEYASKMLEFERANEQYNGALEELNNIDGSIRELNNERLNITINLERQAGEIKVMKSKIAGLREQNALLTDEIERTQKQVEETEKNVGSLSEQKIVQQSAIAEQKRVIEELSAKYLSVTELLMKNEGEVEQAHRELVASMDKLADIKSNMSALRAEKAALEDRIEDYQKRAHATKEEMAVLKGKVNVSELEQADLKIKIASASDSLEAATSEYNENLLAAKELSEKISSATGEVAKMEARQKVLSDMVDNMQGYAYSVRKLCADAKTNSKLGSKIEGHVAALIKVREGMEVAIETALGNAVQNIVVRTEEDAKELIEYLKEKKYGRATFLPISAVRGKKLDREFQRFLQYPGCFGIASELLDFAAKYQDVFDSLLGKTVIVDNLETAIHMAKDSGFHFKIVTLEGDVINPHGAMTGGSKKAETGNMLSSERELSAVNEALSQSKSDLEKLTERRLKAVRAQENALNALRNATAEKQKLELILTEKTLDSQGQSERIESLKTSCFELEQDSRRFFHRIEEIESQLKSVDELETEISSRRSDADSSNQQNQKQYDVLRSNRDKLHEKLTEAKIKEAEITSKFHAIEQEIIRCKSDLISYSSTIETDRDKINRNNILIAQSDVENIEIDNGTEAELRAKVEAIGKRLDGLDEHKKKLQNDMQKNDEIRQNAQMQMSVITEQKAKKEGEIERIDSELSFYLERISEEYNLDYDSCLKYRTDDFNPSQAASEINRLKRDLLRLGNINMNAVEDFEALKKRYDEELSNKKDLEASIADVQKVISDMTKNMLNSFTTQFEKIRENFVQCFRALFGGGNADLILEEGDPLEAGINILAEPPGKKLQNISLLSGGERALTAIAILFAILKLKPMPFCILDEIEAALDDANVERFAKYLHNYSKHTQFIVITHRKPTMELADSLYGVTMEEKGISKIVSVKLSDAVKSIEQTSSAS